MNDTIKLMFITIVGNYIEARDENPMSVREEMALDEIMHWNPEKAIEYLKKKYPEHAETFFNFKTFQTLQVTTQIEMIETEMERIIENMIIS